MKKKNLHIRQTLTYSVPLSLFRQKALKALNERLQKLEQTTTWPSLDGPEGKEGPQSPGAVEEVPEIVVDQGTSKRTEGVPNSASVPT